MASMTMTASFLAASAQPVLAPRRGLIVAKATRVAAEGEKAGVELKSIAKAEERVNGRRDLVFAAATTAVAAIAGAALADDEPKRGTPEAKKKYAPICVTMPTARVCRN
ncbi:photosystem II 5 kDa protein, chloroplastic-like [Punica granatum]|uniref:Photosystem II 5 kDa protein, chloroplastic-like n=1 Tax=Punica granatum TaxID=22663 RepID=A0A218WLK2_PUNGR|nr:photosystem II 5 kDa protein, chloroplastic-like [Punica granatum]OWM73506.1 hypothetical protein CDL15_Pgr026605 [Punica granatum]